MLTPCCTTTEPGVEHGEREPSNSGVRLKSRQRLFVVPNMSVDSSAILFDARIHSSSTRARCGRPCLQLYEASCTPSAIIIRVSNTCCEKMEQRLRRLEHRVRHVENQSHLNELKILALEALKWGVGVATWVEKLILDTILGTLIFFFNIWPVILPILILVLAIIVGYYSRHYIWGPLLWLCVVTIKFFLSIYNTFVDIINTVIHFVDKAVSGIITGVTFGIVHRHHVIPPSFEMPKYGIHHALPGDVYTFFTDPVGFCHTRPHGLEMVVGEP
jgi:hypothetical protein